jgi:autotransporter family porin
VSLYSALPALASLYGRAMIGTLHERVGEEEQLRDRYYSQENNNGAWARVMGWEGERDGGSSGIYGQRGASFDYSLAALQGGFDIYQHEDNDQVRTHAGLMLGVGRADGNVEHINGRAAGDLTIEATSLGAYWTRFDENRSYLDGVALVTWYDAEAHSSRLPALSGEFMGYALSLEGGRPFDLNDKWRIEPQGQIIWQHFDGTSANDVAARVHFEDSDSLIGRIGVRLMRNWMKAEDDGDIRRGQGWARFNVWHEFSDPPATTFSSEDGPVRFQSDIGGTWLQLGGGLSTQISDDGTFYADAAYSWDTENNGDAVSGRVGLRWNW